MKSSQKKAKAASGKKETKATETDSQEGAQAASQDATNSGQTDAGSSSVSTNKGHRFVSNGTRRAGRDLDRNN